MDDLPGTVWLVLPTYNEAENVEGIVAAVRAPVFRTAAGS